MYFPFNVSTLEVNYAINHDLFPHFVDVSSHGLSSLLFMLLLIRPYGSFLVSNWSIRDHPYTYYVSNWVGSENGRFC